MAMCLGCCLKAKEGFLESRGCRARQDCLGCKDPWARPGLLDPPVPQALLALQVKRGKWA